MRQCVSGRNLTTIASVNNVSLPYRIDARDTSPGHIGIPADRRRTYCVRVVRTTVFERRDLRSRVGEGYSRALRLPRARSCDRREPLGTKLVGKSDLLTSPPFHLTLLWFINQYALINFRFSE
jgi:hypothetical protein